MKEGNEVAKGPGRPPKFAEPSRVVTMTLPEATLGALERLDADRARAVVRATEIAAAAALSEDTPKVEMLAVTRDMAVITVPFSRSLSDIRGLKLIQIMPTRYLVVLEPGLPLSEVEVSILDMIETLPEAQGRDREILRELLGQLRAFRRNQRTRMGELILVAI